MSAPIPTRLLIAAQAFGVRLNAERVAAAVADGVVAAGHEAPDRIALPNDAELDLSATLTSCDFDARMKAARALVIVTRRLGEQTLLGSVAFEIATRARQSGVPAYAVTAQNSLSAFDARILDLQVVLKARDQRSLQAAGGELAKIA
ncbi:MAG: hypothetical protein ACYCU0_13475 [Solirubrobacteraceae bacterium]